MNESNPLIFQVRKQTQKGYKLSKLYNNNNQEVSRAMASQIFNASAVKTTSTFCLDWHKSFLNPFFAPSFILSPKATAQSSQRKPCTAASTVFPSLRRRSQEHPSLRQILAEHHPLGRCTPTCFLPCLPSCRDFLNVTLPEGASVPTLLKQYHFPFSSSPLFFLNTLLPNIIHTCLSTFSTGI